MRVYMWLFPPNWTFSLQHGSFLNNGLLLFSVFDSSVFRAHTHKACTFRGTAVKGDRWHKMSPEEKQTTPGKHRQPVIPSSNSTSSFTTALNKRRKTLMWTNHRLKSRRKSTTLSPYSPALSTLKSLLLLCIRHMQSQCAPRHFRDTTVFPFYNWKMAILLNKKGFFSDW